MTTIKIQIPTGYEFDSVDKKNNEVIAKQVKKNPIDRIKTVDDLLADNNISQEKFAQQNEGLEKDEIAYRILKLLAKSLNEGWTPDWNNSNEVKYYPYFEMGGSSGFRCDAYDDWSSCSGVGSRLCFKTGKLAEYAGNQFKEVYKQFMLIK